MIADSSPWRDQDLVLSSLITMILTLIDWWLCQEIVWMTSILILLILPNTNNYSEMKLKNIHTLLSMKIRAGRWPNPTSIVAGGFLRVLIVDISVYHKSHSPHRPWNRISHIWQMDFKQVLCPSHNISPMKQIRSHNSDRDSWQLVWVVLVIPVNVLLWVWYGNWPMITCWSY